MSETMNPSAKSYERIGFVDAPFAAAGEPGSETQWVRLAAHAAANRLLSACVRARRHGRPALVTMSEDIPEYYYRVAQNDLLARTTAEPELGVMALNIPLEMMRLGRIRGTLAELAELVVAVDMPATIGAWYSRALSEPCTDLPEASLVTSEQLDEAQRLFADDPALACERYLSLDAQPLSDTEMDVVVHEAYLRQVGQPVEVEKDEEVAEIVPFDPMGTGPIEAVVLEEVPSPDPANASDRAVRELLLAIAGSRLSPVVSRALAAFGQYGESLAAQELKITKAPRKTLAALLDFMSARWGNIVVIYDSFEAWDLLDQQARVDVLSSLMELRYIIGRTGVMVVGVIDGAAPEIAEQFAAGEQVDWSLPEVHKLSRGDHSFDPVIVDAWLDAASLEGVSPIRATDAVLEPLIEAADGDLVSFSSMAEAAFRSAADRGLTSLDEAAVAFGIAGKEK